MPFEYYSFPLFTFFFGAVVGSFLNVCIYRVPAGLSIVAPPSSCPSCGDRIRWFQNIPIFSYLFLLGRCARCKVRISLRYPMVEALNGALFFLVLYQFGFSPVTLVYWVFVAVLVVITFIDLDHQIIPDVISLPGIAVGFVASFFVPWISWFDSLFGILLGGGLLLSIAWGYQLIAKREGMGGGDIKLLAMFGAFLGWKAILPIVFLASVFGSLIGVPLMLLQKKDGKLALPFGPFLSLAAIIYLLYGTQLLEWYLDFYT